MDHTVPRERDIVVDLESGGNTSEEEGNRVPISGFRQSKNLLDRVWGGLASTDGPIKDEEGVSSRVNSKSTEVATENEKLLMGERLGGEEEKVALLAKITEKKKRKHTTSKKPPRPPRGPSLDAADQKLIREISELAMLKRARIEWLKAQRKMKAANTSSSSSSSWGSSICALVITVLFCLIIIFQGLLSRGNSHAKFLGSPEPAEVPSGGWISVQYYKNVPASSIDGLGYESSNLIEQVSQSGPGEEGIRGAE